MRRSADTAQETSLTSSFRSWRRSASELYTRIKDNSEAEGLYQRIIREQEGGQLSPQDSVYLLLFYAEDSLSVLSPTDKSGELELCNDSLSRAEVKLKKVCSHEYSRELSMLKKLQSKRHYCTARRCKHNRDFREAIKAAEKVDHPVHMHSANILIGEAWEKLGEPSKAIGVWEQVLKNAENITYALRAANFLAMAYQKNGDEKASADLIEEVERRWKRAKMTKKDTAYAETQVSMAKIRVTYGATLNNVERLNQEERKSFSEQAEIMYQLAMSSLIAVVLANMERGDKNREEVLEVLISVLHGRAHLIVEFDSRMDAYAKASAATKSLTDFQSSCRDRLERHYGTTAKRRERPGNLEAQPWLPRPVQLGEFFPFKWQEGSQQEAAPAASEGTECKLDVVMRIVADAKGSAEAEAAAAERKAAAAERKASAAERKAAAAERKASAEAPATAAEAAETETKAFAAAERKASAAADEALAAADEAVAAKAPAAAAEVAADEAAAEYSEKDEATGAEAKKALSKGSDETKEHSKLGERDAARNKKAVVGKPPRRRNKRGAIQRRPGPLQPIPNAPIPDKQTYMADYMYPLLSVGLVVLTTYITLVGKHQEASGVNSTDICNATSIYDAMEKVIEATNLSL